MTLAYISSRPLFAWLYAELFMKLCTYKLANYGDFEVAEICRGTAVLSSTFPISSNNLKTVDMTTPSIHVDSLAGIADKMNDIGNKSGHGKSRTHRGDAEMRRF
jgi:hypothetical protein